MTEILYEYITLFGLNYEPTTFPQLFTWMILVLCAVAIVCGIIRSMFEICTLSIKGGSRK
uniref:hypothetical protein n=1 Tax=Acetatifactor sp. TaxID=1872090 RepID=UPI004055A9F7